MKTRVVLTIASLALGGARCAAQDTCSESPGARLSQVLACYSLPAGPAIKATLRTPITSYAAVADNDSFIIGYYLHQQDGYLRPPLFIAHYSKLRRQWRQIELAQFNAESGDGRSVSCLGSVMEIWPVPNGYYLRTHLNPSAGCLLVLSSDLRLKKVLYGWPLLYFRDGLLIYQRSMVHFAPTHPLEIRTWNPSTDREQTIYPQPSSLLRQTHIEKAREAWSDEAWCHAHNHHCDPARFDDWLAARGSVHEETDSVAFVVRFGTDFRRESGRPTGVDVLYVCRGLHRPHSLECKEMLYEHFEARFRGNLQKLRERSVFEALFPQ